MQWENRQQILVDPRIIISWSSSFKRVQQQRVYSTQNIDRFQNGSLRQEVLEKIGP